MEKFEYVYVSKHNLGNGEFSVSGRLSDDSLVFGFRTKDYFGWREKARLYAGKGIAVFDKRPKLITGRVS